MGKVIAVANQKGGVGKTTTAVNIAGFLVLNGKKVLIIDLDPQANATTHLGLIPDDLNSSAIDFLFSEALPLVNYSALDGLYIIPSSLTLAEAEIKLFSTPIGREQILQKKLEKIKDNFDFIFIDCPPNLGPLTINALVGADHLLIPVQTQYLPMDGLKTLISVAKDVSQMYKKERYILGILPTMYAKREKACQEILEKMKSIDFVAEFVFENIIRRSVSIQEATMEKKPICIYKANSLGAKDYQKATEEFIRRCENGK